MKKLVLKIWSFPGPTWWLWKEGSNFLWWLGIITAGYVAGWYVIFGRRAWGWFIYKFQFPLIDTGKWPAFGYFFLAGGLIVLSFAIRAVLLTPGSEEQRNGRAILKGLFWAFYAMLIIMAFSTWERPAILVIFGNFVDLLWSSLISLF